MKFSQFAIVVAFLCTVATAGTIQAQDAAKTVIADISKVDKAPAFPGGQEALTTHLKEKVVYPAACRMSQAKGTVKVGFIVNTDGAITSVEHLGDPEMDNRLIKEGLRVVGAMPKWEPATVNGEKVACKMVLPIYFAPN
jgi:hypothetical protein